MSLSMSRGERLEMDEFQVMAIIGVKDPTLYDWIKAQLINEGLAEAEAIEGVVRKLDVPVRRTESWAIAPLVATDGDQVYLTTHGELFDLALETQASGANLRDVEDFQQMAHSAQETARRYSLERWAEVIRERLEEAWGVSLGGGIRAECVREGRNIQ